MPETSVLNLLLLVITGLMGIQTPFIVFYAVKVWKHEKDITEIKTRCQIYHERELIRLGDLKPQG